MLEIEVEERAGAAQPLRLVRASGEVDLSNASELAGALEEADGATVVDLASVPFMDSSGVRVLLLAAERKPRFAVVLRPGSPVLRLLEISDVTGRIRCFESEAEAIAALAAADPG